MMTGSQDKHSKKIFYLCKVKFSAFDPKKGISIDLKSDEMFAPKIKLEKRGGGQK